jgi:ketosteroid isomerase-like protein
MFTAIRLSAVGPSAQDDPAAAVRGLDARFWAAYNSCDTAALAQFFTRDVEFYHDKGGPTFGVDALVNDIRTNLCAGGNRVRREAVPESVHIALLRKQQTVYGAIITGTHRFFVREPGGDEHLDGQASFTHLWLLDATGWRMARILSYDHGPAPYVNTRRAVAVTDADLERWVGEYRAEHSGTIRVAKVAATLAMTFDNGDPPLTLFPSGPAEFFLVDRDITFEFDAAADGGRVVMRVRERGHVVEEAVKQ